MRVKRNTLILIAGIVCCGFCRIYHDVPQNCVKAYCQNLQHGRRPCCGLAFFDKKSYLLMVFMIGLGIALRSTGIAPDRFIAVFYTGLGSALTLAGILFKRAFLRAAGEGLNV